MWYLTLEKRPGADSVEVMHGMNNLIVTLAKLFNDGVRIGEITFDRHQMTDIQAVLGNVIPAFTDLVNDGPVREGFQSLTWPLTNMIAGMCALSSFGQSLVIDSSSTGRARDFQVRGQLRDSFASGPSRCNVCKRNVENDAKVYATSDHMYVCYSCAALPRFVRPDTWIEIELDQSTLPTDGSEVEFKTLASEMSEPPFTRIGIYQEAEQLIHFYGNNYLVREITAWRYKL